MAKGYIRLHRSIEDNWVWQDKPFSKGQAWVDLLLLANHSDHKTPYGSTVIECNRGEVNRSMRHLAERWGWNRDKVRTFLHQLEADGMITLNPTTKPTTQPTAITIENYDKYQCQPTQTDQQTDHQNGQLPTSYRPVTDQLPATNNKYINVLNDFNDFNLSAEGEALWAKLRSKAGR